MMGKFITTLLATAWLGANVFASSYWSKQYQEPEELLRNPRMRFTNRAQCALDAEKPADKFLLILSHEHIGKALYRLAKRLEVENPKQFIQNGILELQKHIAYSLQDVHNKLVNNQLPLLTDELVKNAALDTKNDSVIKALWYKANSRQHNGISGLNLRCEKLIQFSPLEAQLYGTKPTVKALNSIAHAATQPEAYYQDCDEYFTAAARDSSQIDLTASTFHLKYKNLPSGWNDAGFDYLASMKTYLAYAFRNETPTRLRTLQYDYVLRSLALEDISFLFPSNCKSMTPPSCSEEFVSTQKIREFATKNFKQKVGRSDFLNPFTENLTEDMLLRPTPPVNSDILDLNSTKTASEWANRMNKQFSDVRLIMKRKLFGAINTFNVMLSALGTGDLNQLLGRQIAPLLKEAPAGTAKEYTDFLKQEFYYLCSEVTLVNHEYFSFLVKDLAHLEQTNNIDFISNGLTNHKQKEIFQYYERMADFVQNICEAKDQHDIWDDTFKLNKSGFSEWYLAKIHDGKIKSEQNQLRKKWQAFHAPILTQKNQFNEQVNICYSPIDCARLALNSIVDLYQVSKYQATFFPKDSVNTPSAFNPYAERMACKVYDPWFKTQQTLVQFFSDIGNAALAYFTNSFIFSNFNLKPGRVVSFKTLVQEGKIQYQAIKDPKKLEAALALDMGPLFGVPCTIAVSGPRIRQSNILQYSGVTIGACHSTQKRSYTVYAASDIQRNKPINRNFCFDCQINFESAASMLVGFGPVTSALYIVRAFIRLFKGLNDPQDVPKTWDLNLKHLLETYQKFGTIPAECRANLAAGKRCLLDSCEEKLLYNIDKETNHLVQSIKKVNQRDYHIMMNGCSEPYVARESALQHTSVNGNRRARGKMNRCLIKTVHVPRRCRK